jgi:hypothetical protein
MTINFASMQQILASVAAALVTSTLLISAAVGPATQLI